MTWVGSDVEVATSGSAVVTWGAVTPWTGADTGVES